MSGKTFTIFGDNQIEVLVSSASNGGAYFHFTNTAPPGGGPPPHVHTLEDEFIIPIEGEFEVFDGKQWAPIPKQGIFAPRNQVHTWRNCGSTEGKISCVATGSSFEAFFNKLPVLDLPRDMEKFIAIAAEHGISLALPTPQVQEEEAELVGA